MVNLIPSVVLVDPLQSVLSLFVLFLAPCVVDVISVAS